MNVGYKQKASADLRNDLLGMRIRDSVQEIRSITWELYYLSCLWDVCLGDLFKPGENGGVK